MDAVPVTLGQEFAGYAAQIRLGARRVRNALPQVAQIPLGGTATGTGLNTHPEFAARVRAQARGRRAGWRSRRRRTRSRRRRNRDALVELSGALKVIAVSLTKIANDLALMGSGPRAGIGELFLPELQKGSSIMPGKVNPVIPEVVLQVSAQVIGNDTAITIGGLQGQFELNVRIPLIARNLLQSIRCSRTPSRLFAEKCVDGIEANLAGCERSAESTLAVATALNPFIGYDKGAEIVKDASASGRTLREVAREHGVDEATLDKALDLRKIAAGSKVSCPPDRAHRALLRRGAALRGARRGGRPARLFIGAGVPWPYYARPRRAAEVARRGRRGLRARQRELGVPEAFEWVHERRRRCWPPPREAGLDVLEAPLMVLDPARVAPRRGARRHRAAPRRARRPGLAAARAVPNVGFGAPGHGCRRAGLERDAAAAAESEAATRPGPARAVRRGLTVTVVAGTRTGPSRPARTSRSATSPRSSAWRRCRSSAARASAARSPARWCEDALARGVETVFLSAGSEDIARVYGRLGFQRVGTACIVGDAHAAGPRACIRPPVARRRPWRRR